MNETACRVRIRCTPEALWGALTDTEVPRPWKGGETVHSSWAPEAAYELRAGGSVVALGHVIAIDPPRRLKATFDPRWDPAVVNEPPGTLEYRIEAAEEGTCELTVRITGLSGASAAAVERDTSATYLRLKEWIEAGRDQ
ncbi:ArsR family transcriptional regulator [Sinomonas atrocyanea]|uniref:ArsR family transcriptional regulator n=1 Tax=Sinomonas atrocyanea TaxID=37927 RepID=A0A127A517_9MICC|nr:SRPBCC domain-containing protein [Sinomonas atrocyanea]AMM34560.1 ArsR family transcriptional regulator [Sinomonas atrocyanea]GEB63039.1 ATPase [Sinomonas atrocyanea]GGG79871.1 ATPase [Sinomonas atrocyanea]